MLPSEELLNMLPVPPMLGSRWRSWETPQAAPNNFPKENLPGTHCQGTSKSWGALVRQVRYSLFDLCHKASPTVLTLTIQSTWRVLPGTHGPVSELYHVCFFFPTHFCGFSSSPLTFSLALGRNVLCIYRQ